MQYYITSELNLAQDIIDIIDNYLGYPTAYTQTWAVAKQRVTDQSWYVDVPHVNIAIPFGNISTETYSVTWLPADTTDYGNV